MRRWLAHWLQYRNPLYHAFWGWYYGFPACCVLEFITDTFTQRLSATERGVFEEEREDGSTKCWVPCSRCVRGAVSSLNIADWDMTMDYTHSG